ncbi:MAG: glycosyltransferase family 4 protein [Clostridia bacterium]|nr:glycosyltransferase family 4 protein [Clostridia bacterium]
MENERKIRVLMVEHHSPGSLYVLELGRQLKRDCDITVFCKADTRLSEPGMTWLPQFYPGGKGKIGSILAYGRTLLRLGRLIRKGRFDVLHIQSFKNAAVEMKLYAALRRYVRQLVMTVHNVLPHEPAPGDQALYGAFYRRCDLLIVHNEASKRELQRLFAIPDEKIAVIAHGAYQTYALDKPRRAEAGRTRFLLFGRIRPYKGIDILLKAISLLDEETRSKCLFTIRGKQYPKIDPTDYPALIRQYGIGDCVCFSAQRVPDEEIPALLGDADIAVFPYRKIYGSGALLMAYTYGVPVIASDIPTFREETDGGQTGLLFAPEDPAALRDAILAAVQWDEKQIDRYRQHIRRLVSERYSWNESARKTAEAYRKAGTP